jgi:hypothetical protein
VLKETLLASRNGGHCIRSKSRSAQYGTSNKSISLKMRHTVQVKCNSKNEKALKKLEKTLFFIVASSLIAYKVFFSETTDDFIPQLSKSCCLLFFVRWDLHKEPQIGNSR